MSNIKKLKFLGIAIIATIYSIDMLAIPAKPGVLVVNNADGTPLEIILHGDESKHFTTTTEGFVITKNEDGDYVYLTKDDDGEISISNIKVTNNDLRSYSKLVSTSDMHSLGINFRKNKEMRISSPMSTKGQKKGIVLLVEFSDVKFQITSPNKEFSDMLNIKGYTNTYGQIGSAKDYFYDVSMGQFDPEFEVIGPISLPNTLANYGGNGSDGYDKDPARMVYDALKLTDLSSINMSELDSDDNGYVDNLFVFYAGHSEAEGGAPESIWPHAASLKLLLSLPDNLLPQKDGIKFNDYACGSELADADGTRMSGIGAFCHEFSHILGLPDTYDTDYSTNGQAFGLDAWSLMANGPYNGNGNIPPSLNAWERWKSGWLTLTELNEADDYKLAPLQESNQAYILKNSENEKEYFILENRQQTMWDRALPGHGMLIYHLDFTSTTPWYNNQVNANASRQCFELEVADNIQSKATLSGDPYPGSSNKREFTDTTSPSSRLWSGQLMNKPITSINEIDGEIEFKLSGGFIMSAPSNIVESNITENSFELNWEASDRATNYYLDVYTESGVDNGKINKVWDFANGIIDSELTPSGSFTANIDKYGENAPSMSATNQNRDITTPNLGFELEYFSFWYTIEDNNEYWSIKLEALSNGSWQNFDTLSKDNSTPNQVYETSSLPENTTRVKITWQRGTPTNIFYIDDISIAYHDKSIVKEFLDGFENKSIGNTTSHEITGTRASTLYKCVIRASNEYSTSSDSDVIEVLTSEATSIEDQAKSEIKVFKTGDGTLAIQNRSDKTVEAKVFAITGCLIHTQQIEVGEQFIKLNIEGICIVHIDGHAYKVVL